jgi:hypothetical protein
MAGGNRDVVTSRIRPASGPKSQWQIDDETSFPLPVVVVEECVDQDTGQVGWQVQATVDLVDGHPVLTRVDVTCGRGIDVVRARRAFAWSRPLDLVTRTVPRLLKEGIDPFTVDPPVDESVMSAAGPGPINARLSEDFLEGVAREYLQHGRGYSKAMAVEHNVSQRTVVNWVQKARWRGILTRVPGGSYGGHIIPKAERRSN